jgi:hypothetical protein
VAYASVVAGRHLTANQLRKVIQYLTPRRDYLEKLCERLTTLGLPVTDPLYVSTSRAWVEVDRLVVGLETLHRRAALPSVVERGHAWAARQANPEARKQK